MKLFKYIISVVIILLLWSCQDPYWFVLNNRTSHSWLLHGHKMCDMDSVEVYADDAFYMHQQSRVALRKVEMTEFEADFTLKIMQGHGVNFYLRSAMHNFESHNQVKFSYDSSGCNIFENGELIRYVDSVYAEPDERKRVIIKNFSHSYLILVDCDTVIYSRTKIPNSEYIIIESQENAEIDIRGITFTEIPDHQGSDYIVY